jgi:hypothetical protein
MKTVISLFLKDQYNNKTKMEEIITNSSLRWEIIRPGMLTNKDKSSAYKAITRLPKGMKVGKISRADVADYLIKEAEDLTRLYQYVALTN